MPRSEYRARNWQIIRIILLVRTPPSPEVFLWTVQKAVLAEPGSVSMMSISLVHVRGFGRRTLFHRPMVDLHKRAKMPTSQYNWSDLEVTTLKIGTT